MIAPVVIFLTFTSTVLCQNPFSNITVASEELADITKTFLNQNPILKYICLTLDIGINQSSLFSTKYQVRILLSDTDDALNFDIESWAKCKDTFLTYFIPFIDFTPYKLKFKDIFPYHYVSVPNSIFILLVYDVL